MKYSKRILSIAVALSLALTLTLPTTAADHWEDAYFITQPQNLFVPHGESFMLSVEVNIPDGIESVTYQWYSLRNGHIPIEGATTAAIQFSPGDPSYPQSSGRYGLGAGGSHVAIYSCKITVYPEDSNIQPKFCWSYPATVTVEGTFDRKLYSLTLEPFVYAFDTCLDFFVLFGPFGFIYYPYFLFERYIASFNAVFR